MRINKRAIRRICEKPSNKNNLIIETWGKRHSFSSCHLLNYQDTVSRDSIRYKASANIKLNFFIEYKKFEMLGSLLFMLTSLAKKEVKYYFQIITYLTNDKCIQYNINDST